MEEAEEEEELDTVEREEWERVEEGLAARLANRPPPPPLLDLR